MSAQCVCSACPAPCLDTFLAFHVTAFQTKPEFEGKGYFSKLYKFMEQDLKKTWVQKINAWG